MPPQAPVRPPAGLDGDRPARLRRRELITESESRHYPYFGAPPARQPRPATEEPTLRGKRVVLSMPDGFVYDMRCASEVYRDGDGREVVDIVSEEHFYRWMLTREPPSREPYPVHLVWVE